MSKPTVFISYSHEDEKWKNRLTTHLEVLQVQGRLELWDDSKIGAGEDWYQQIQRAMNTADVAILLISANSLTSRFILREEMSQLLQRRNKEGLRILPIITKPCAWEEIEWLARMQVRPKHHLPLSAGSEYEIDVHMTEIVKEIATVINRPYKLPTPSAGPEYVQFVVVAGRADELKSIRANVDPYGDECWQWRPYYPEFEKSVGPFVQGVVASENLASGWLQPTASLPEELERAKGKNIVVVVIVDVWTIRLSSYHELMRKFDKRSFFNCAVLIPWNSQDGETEQNHDKLETALRVTFENKMASKDPRSFREGITSPEELDSELRDVLIEIRRRILETGEVFRKAVGESVIVQPQINGPGGVEPL